MVFSPLGCVIKLALHGECLKDINNACFFALRRGFFQADQCSGNRNGISCRQYYFISMVFLFIRVVQKDPKDKWLKLCVFAFVSFHMILTTSTTECEPGITFPVSLDNTTCTFNSGKAKMLKGLGQRFHQFARLPYRVLGRKSFLTNALRD